MAGETDETFLAALAQKYAESINSLQCLRKQIHEYQRKEAMERGSLEVNLAIPEELVFNIDESIWNNAKSNYKRLQDEKHAKDAEIALIKAEQTRMVMIDIQERDMLQQSIHTLESNLKAEREKYREAQSKLNDALERVALLEGDLTGLKHSSDLVDTSAEESGQHSNVHHGCRSHILVLQDRISKSEEKNATLAAENRTLLATRHDQEATMSRLRDVIHKTIPRSASASKLMRHASSDSISQKTPRIVHHRSVSSSSQATTIAPNFSTLPMSPVLENQIVIPARRAKEIGKYPVITPDLRANSIQSTFFSRTFLSAAMKVGAILEILNARQQTTGYLTPNLDQNPWCPVNPGEHGYIFVNLADSSFTQEEVHNVFIGMSLNHEKRRKYRYLGVYSALKMDVLSSDEWSSLSDRTRRKLCERDQSKNGDRSSLDEIAQEYLSGKLIMGCVRLRCIGFNVELYNILSSQNIDI